MKKPLAIHNASDVVSFLKQQHEQIKGLFTAVLARHGTGREEAFLELRRLMAIHETAEEEVVHPAAKRARGIGEAIVAARLREENEAKKALIELEKLDVDSADFASKFRTLNAAVLAHAQSEEVEEFEKLTGELSEDHLLRMRKAVQFAEAVSPTRAHPGIESPGANMLIGPFATLVDRARDAIEGKM
jgi:hemerythrin superfamily protein